jgi:hypothetical protein
MAMTPKRPRDPNQLAEAIIDIATGEKPDDVREVALSVSVAEPRVGPTAPRR